MPRPPSGQAGTRGYAPLTRESTAQASDVEQGLRGSSPSSAPPAQQRHWRDTPSVDETEMEAAAVRSAWAARSNSSSAVAAAASAAETAEVHSNRADLLGAFQACDIDGDGRIGPHELLAILLAIGAETDLETVRQIVAEAERLTDDESRARAAAALPRPTPAAQNSRGFRRPYAALSLGGAYDAVTDAVTGVAGTVTSVAETVATAVVEVAEEAAERAGLAESTEVSDHHDGQLDFPEFERLMSGALLEPLLWSSVSPRPREDDAVAAGDSTETPEAAADVALLDEHFLGEHAERLRHDNMLGKLKGATPAYLLSIGMPMLHTRTLLAAATMAPDARARQRVGRIRALRRAFETADVDSDNKLEREELETVVVALHPCTPSPDDVEHLWLTLNPTRKQEVTWRDFLCGMADVRKDARARLLMDLSRPNEWALISLLIDVKFPEAEAAALMSGLSPFERVGIATLQSKAEPLTTEQLRTVLGRAATGRLRYIDPERATAILYHQRRIGVIAFLIAFVTNAIPGLWENWTAYQLNSNGITDLFYTCNDVGPLEIEYDITLEPCPTSKPAVIAEFWARDLPVIIVCILLEIVLLGVFAVRTACAIASEYGYRLYPLNPERYFVAMALIRACFEMGNPKSGVLGDDPVVESTFRRRLRLGVVGMIYGLKIVLLGVLVKQVMGATLPVSYATWAVSYAALVSSCFWDTLVCRVIMEQVALTANGIATAPEVFNEIVSKAHLTRAAEMVCIRAIAVAVGTQGTMMPTMELLLRHAIQYFGISGSQSIEAPSSPLDSVPVFLSEMRALRADEQEVVMSILLLAQILDGGMDEPELLLWSRVHRHVGRQLAPDESGLKGCACSFRNGQRVDAALLHAALDEDYSNDRPPELGLGDSAWFNVRKLLLK